MQKIKTNNQILPTEHGIIKLSTTLVKFNTPYDSTALYGIISETEQDIAFEMLGSDHDFADETFKSIVRLTVTPVSLHEVLNDINNKMF